MPSDQDSAPGTSCETSSSGSKIIARYVIHQTDKRRPIISVDFDGVLHSYNSGWKGPRNIPDPPFDGALEWLAAMVEEFDVQIFSSRSHYPFGRTAMKRWLVRQYRALAPTARMTPDWFRRRIFETAFADPWQEEVRFAARRIVGRIKFPLFKPPALLTLDDRAVCFDGTFPTSEWIRAFRPWYKRPAV